MQLHRQSLAPFLMLARPLRALANLLGGLLNQVLVHLQASLLAVLSSLMLAMRSLLSPQQLGHLVGVAAAQADHSWTWTGLAAVVLLQPLQWLAEALQVVRQEHLVLPTLLVALMATLLAGLAMPQVAVVTLLASQAKLLANPAVSLQLVALMANQLRLVIQVCLLLPIQQAIRHLQRERQRRSPIWPRLPAWFVRNQS